MFNLFAHFYGQHRGEVGQTQFQVKVLSSSLPTNQERGDLLSMFSEDPKVFIIYILMLSLLNLIDKIHSIRFLSPNTQLK